MRQSYIHVMLSVALGLALVACDEGNGESASSGQAQKMQPGSKGASKSGGLEAPSGSAKKKLGAKGMKARRKAMKKKIAKMKKRKAMVDEARKAAEKAEKKGDTPCGKAFHSAVAMSDSMRKQQGKKAKGEKASKEGFVSKCKELPGKFQKCLIPSYTRENRGKCAKLHKNADDKVKGQIRNLMKQMK